MAACSQQVRDQILDLIWEQTALARHERTSTFHSPYIFHQYSKILTWGPVLDLWSKRAHSGPYMKKTNSSCVLLARNHLSMYCDYRAMPKYLMDHSLALGPHYGALVGPQNGPKINFFVYGARTFKFSGITILWCRKSLVQKFFSYGAIMSLKGAPKSAIYVKK